MADATSTVHGSKKTDVKRKPLDTEFRQLGVRFGGKVHRVPYSVQSKVKLVALPNFPLVIIPRDVILQLYPGHGRGGGGRALPGTPSKIHFRYGLYIHVRLQYMSMCIGAALHDHHNYVARMSMENLNFLRI